MLYTIREWVTEHIPDNGFLSKLLQFIYRRIPAGIRQPESKIPKILAFFAESYEGVTIMQIGANDGITGDPLHELIVNYNWSGVLVEPIKYVFDRLVKNYQGVNGIVCANVAISQQDENRDMWFLKESDDQLPETYDQLGSFRYDILYKHRRDIKDIHNYMAKTQVQCMTFKHLCDIYAIETVHLLQMDVEGYDYELLTMFDFDRFMPIIAMFEHKHMTPVQRTKIKKYLSDKGYIFYADNADSIAMCSEFAQKVKLHKII